MVQVNNPNFGQYLQDETGQYIPRNPAQGAVGGWATDNKRYSDIEIDGDDFEIISTGGPTYDAISGRNTNGIYLVIKKDGKNIAAFPSFHAVRYVAED